MSQLIELTLGGRIVCVADIKKAFIENIYNNIHLCEAIDKVVVFGSAIETRCEESSDVDIAVFGTISKTKMYSLKSYRKFIDAVVSFNHEQDYDILYFDSTKDNQDTILKDIRKGVILFERHCKEIPNMSAKTFVADGKPVMPSELPKGKFDFRGLIAYADKKGVKPNELKQ